MTGSLNRLRVLVCRLGRSRWRRTRGSWLRPAVRPCSGSLPPPRPSWPCRPATRRRLPSRPGAGGRRRWSCGCLRRRRRGRRSPCRPAPVRSGRSVRPPAGRRGGCCIAAPARTGPSPPSLTKPRSCDASDVFGAPAGLRIDPHRLLLEGDAQQAAVGLLGQHLLHDRRFDVGREDDVVDVEAPWRLGSWPRPRRSATGSRSSAVIRALLGVGAEIVRVGDDAIQSDRLGQHDRAGPVVDRAAQCGDLALGR